MEESQEMQSEQEQQVTEDSAPTPTAENARIAELEAQLRNTVFESELYALGY